MEGCGRCRDSAEEPLPRPLGLRSDAYLGSPHKPHQNSECLQTGNVHHIPFFRGSTCSLGEKFSECLADKIDQMQARSPAAKICRLHVEASPAERSQHSPTSQDPLGYLPKSTHSFAVPCHQRPSREYQSQRRLSGSLKRTIPLNRILGNKFTCRHKLEARWAMRRWSRGAQLSTGLGSLSPLCP